MRIESEMSVLGCMVLDDDAAKEAIDKLAPSMFSNVTTRRIFSKATDLYWAGKKVDATILIEELPDDATTILKLAGYVPMIHHLNEYMQIVIDNWRKAAIKHTLGEVLTESDNRTADESVDVIRELVKKQDAVLKTQGNESTSFSEAVQQFTDWMKSNKEQNTIKTGYHTLDYAMGGFLKKSVTALCARSGCGKTDFALNLVIRMAQNGFKVQYFTMEMTTLQLMQRVASQMAYIDGNLIRDKKLSGEEMDDMEAVLNAFEHCGKIDFVDESKVSVKTIQHHIDLFKPDVVFIDHIGLMERPNIKDQYRALGQVSNELKQLAKEKNISIIELVQMNRQIEGRKDKKPNLSDIRESGDIEQDADYAMFIQPEDMTEKQISGNAWAETTLYLLKNRHGRPGTFSFHWQPQYHTFTEIETRYE